MGARSKLMCGTISCLILGLVLFVAGSSYVIFCECYPVAGYVTIAVGVIVIAANVYLLSVVLTNRSDLIPKGACKWCCYGPLWGCIDGYRKEMASYHTGTWTVGKDKMAVTMVESCGKYKDDSVIQKKDSEEMKI